MSKRPRPALNYVLAVLSGVLLTLAFPPFDLIWFAPFALTPLLLGVSWEPRPKHRFLLGYLTGNVYWFGVCSWIQFVLEVHGGMGRWGGWGTFVLFSLFKSLQMAVFAMLAAIVLRKWYSIPAVAAIWTALERTHEYTAFAWLCLGNAGIDMALPMRLAPWLGVYGLSFLFAMMAAAGTGVALQQPRKMLLWLAVIPVLLTLPPLPDLQQGSETAVLVQPNLDEEMKWTPEILAQTEQKLVDRSYRLALKSHASLIVWPETPGPFYYYRDPRFRDLVGQLARLTHASLLFGTVADTKEGAPLNSAVLLNPQGELVDRYDKINLVPFGEFVPPLFSWVNRITQEAGDFVPGTRFVVAPLGAQRVGTFICYESAFPDEVRQFVKRGATLLVNISNDGYFGTSGARFEHLEIVRMRAAENRRWILRATNNGVTAAIDPAGRVVAHLPGYEEAAGDFHYSYETESTAYTQYGDWFAWGCWPLAGWMLFMSQWPHYSPRPRHPAKRVD